MRLRFLLPLLAVAMFAQAARADEAADRHAAAVALLDKLHPADAVTSMMPSIIGQIRANLTRNDPDLVKQFDGFAPQLAAEGDAAKSDLVAKITDVYAQTYTVDDLNAMSAFYQSPVGQKVIASQSELNGKMLSVARDWGNAIAQKMAKEAAANLQGTKP